MNDQGQTIRQSKKQTADAPTSAVSEFKFSEEEKEVVIELSVSDDSSQTDPVAIEFEGFQRQFFRCEKNLKESEERERNLIGHLKILRKQLKKEKIIMRAIKAKKKEIEKKMFELDTEHDLYVGQTATFQRGIILPNHDAQSNMESVYLRPPRLHLRTSPGRRPSRPSLTARMRMGGKNYPKKSFD